jgi:hypothetical protein
MTQPTVDIRLYDCNAIFSGSQFDIKSLISFKDNAVESSRYKSSCSSWVHDNKTWPKALLCLMMG